MRTSSPAQWRVRYPRRPTPHHTRTLFYYQISPMTDAARVEQWKSDSSSRGLEVFVWFIILSAVGYRRFRSVRMARGWYGVVLVRLSERILGYEIIVDRCHLIRKIWRNMLVVGGNECNISVHCDHCSNLFYWKQNF